MWVFDDLNLFRLKWFDPFVRQNFSSLTVVNFQNLDLQQIGCAAHPAACSGMFIRKK